MALSSVAAGTLLTNRREERALSGAVGVALWADILFLLGTHGWLRPIVVAAIAAAVIAAATWKWSLLEKKGTSPDSVLSPQPSALALLLALLAIPTFLLALAPPVAFDETAYHLVFTRAFANDGVLQFLPDRRFAVFPQFHELLTVPAYFLGGAVATHLVALLTAALTVLVVVTWGRRAGSPAAGWLAAALFAGGPVVVHLATISYVEMTITLFVTAGFYCVDRARTEIGAWPLYAGILFGAACSVKYTGIAYACLALLAMIVVARKRLRDSMLFILGLAVIALPTYAHIFQLTGNPLFPFATSLFGGSAWNLDAAPVLTTWQRVTASVRVPWDVVFARGRMNEQPPFTPWLIPLLLVVLASARRDRRAAFVVLAWVACLAAFSFAPQDPRYLVPLLPVLALTASLPIAAALQRRLSSSMITIVLIAAIAPGIAYGAWRLARQGMPPTTAAAQHEFTLRRVPELAALDHARGGAIFNCGAEQLVALTRERYVGDFSGRYRFEDFMAMAAPERAAWLRRIDVDYYLMSKRRCPDGTVPGLQLVYEDASAALWRVR
jgi:hypothetical protein